MSEASGVIKVPLGLQVLEGGDVVLSFGPMPPDELLDAIALLETVEGQVSFHRQLAEGIEQARRRGRA